jgi:hypothetical protein
VGSSMVARQMTTSEQKVAFLKRLAATAIGLDPASRLESIGFLLGRVSPSPRYDFRLSGGKPSSWSLLSDLGTLGWQADLMIGEPFDRVRAIQVKSAHPLSDESSSRLRTLLEKYDARRLDQLAGLVFVQQLLTTTGRPSDDAAIVDKYWQTLPPKHRPNKEDLPLEDAREVFALAA